MTKAELISEVAIATGYDKATVSVIAEALLSSVKVNMSKGKNVYIRTFGSFVLRGRKEKVARDITKRTSVYVPAHSVPVFKPAAEFREMVHATKPKKKATAK